VCLTYYNQTFTTMNLRSQTWMTDHFSHAPRETNAFIPSPVQELWYGFSHLLVGSRGPANLLLVPTGRLDHFSRPRWTHPIRLVLCSD